MLKLNSCQLGMSPVLIIIFVGIIILAGGFVTYKNLTDEKTKSSSRSIETSRPLPKSKPLLNSPTPTPTASGSVTPTPTPTPTPTLTLTPTPTPALTGSSTINMNVWLLQYIPPGGASMDPVAFTKNTLIPAMGRASNYHGYSNPSATQALSFTLSDSQIKTENNPPQVNNSKYDYGGLFSRYDLCNLAKANDIRLVILWADGAGEYAGYFYESAITGSKGIPTNGEILSFCPEKTILILGLNYTRGLAEALESYGHHLERAFGHFHGADFNNWTDRDSCGSNHNPPNSRFEYDRSNTADFQSDCRNWKQDNTGAKETLNCNTWGCSSDGWLIWWMQNMPGDWWRHIGNPDG